MLQGLQISILKALGIKKINNKLQRKTNNKLKCNFVISLKRRQKDEGGVKREKAICFHLVIL